MTIDFETLKAEILATPDDVSRAIKLSDGLGNAYGQVAWAWDAGELGAIATRLPNGYEGMTLGVDDMPRVTVQSHPGTKEEQAQDVALRLYLWGIAVVPSPNEGGAAKPAIAPVKVNVKTDTGQALARVSCSDGLIQILIDDDSSKQPPLVMMLDESLVSDVIPSIRKLAECAQTQPT